MKRVHIKEPAFSGIISVHLNLLCCVVIINFNSTCKRKMHTISSFYWQLFWVFAVKLVCKSCAHIALLVNLMILNILLHFSKPQNQKSMQDVLLVHVVCPDIAFLDQRNIFITVRKRHVSRWYVVIAMRIRIYSLRRMNA